jgi:hypothetical protein
MKPLIVQLHGICDNALSGNNYAEAFDYTYTYFGTSIQAVFNCCTMIKKIAGVLTGGILLIYGCYNNKEELLYGNTSCDGNTSFALNVNPIIQANCAIPDCHAAGSTNGPGPLITYEQIKNVDVKIKSAVVSRFMPKTGSLTASQIRTISCWVDAGAPNN